MITLAVIAKYLAGYQALVDSAIPNVSQIVVALDDGADEGIEGYQQGYVQYYRRPLAGNFAEQRNFLCDVAKGDWVLHLDTDENLHPWLWERLASLCDEQVADVVMLPRLNYYVEDPLVPHDWPDWQPKLHRAHVRWHLPVHEWPYGQHSYTKLPAEQQYAIRHIKTHAAQERANKLYDSIRANADRDNDSVQR